MPLEWKIDDAKRRVRIIARGSFAPREFFTYLAELQETGAFRYSKLFDLTGFVGPIQDRTIRALGEAVVRQSSLDKAPGPMALVVPDPAHRAQAELYIASSAAVKRPIRIFDDAAEAERWLDEQERVSR